MEARKKDMGKWHEAFQAVRFASAGLGQNSGVLGAAAFALEQMKEIDS